MKHLGALLCGLLLLSPAAADPAGEAVLRDQIKALDADPDWNASAGAVRSDGPSTLAENLSLELLSPKAAISAKEVRIENLVQGVDAGFSFTGGSISDFRVVSPLLAAVVPHSKPDQPDESLTIGRLEIGGIEFSGEDQPSPLSQLEPGSDPETRNAAVLEALSEAPKLRHMALRELVLGNTVPLRLEGLKFDVEDYLGPIPVPWQAEMTNLALPGLYVRSLLKHVEPRAAQLLSLLDEKVFILDARGGETWINTANGEIRSSAEITINDGATISVDYTYVGASEELLGSVVGEVLFGNLRKAVDQFDTELKLKSFTLRINDRALLDEIFGAIAAELRLGIDGRSYRQQISSFALPLFMLALGNQELTDTFQPALQEFLGAGKPLVIQSQLTEPVPAREIADAVSDAESLIALLNLTVTTEDSAALQ
jgi:hypothetical protein